MMALRGAPVCAQPIPGGPEACSCRHTQCVGCIVAMQVWQPAASCVCCLCGFRLVACPRRLAGLPQVYACAHQRVASCTASVCLHVCGLRAPLLMAHQGAHLSMCSTEPLRPEAGCCRLACRVGGSGLVQGCCPAGVCALCLVSPVVLPPLAGAGAGRAVATWSATIPLCWLLWGLWPFSQGGCSWGLPCVRLSLGSLGRVLCPGWVPLVVPTLFTQA